MANRFWVGGTNFWNNTAGTKWALTSGGVGGQTVPGIFDNVFFDAASGAVTCTWASGASATVLSINCTGFTGTLATGGNSKTLSGTGTVWTSPATCTITGAPTLTVSTTGTIATSVTCNHASPSATNAPNFLFSGGTYALTINGTGFRQLSWSSSGGGQVIAGTVSVYGSVFTNHIKNFTGLNITFLATATFNFNSANSSITQFPILGDITINAPGGSVGLQDNVFPSPFTLGTTKTLALTAGTFSIGGRPVSTGRFSSNGTSTRVYSTESGSLRVQTIELTSTTPGTTVLDMANATGFSFFTSPSITLRPTFVRNQAATATMVFGTTGGTTSNACNLTVNAGASDLTITNGSHFKNVNFTSSTSTVSGSYNAYGDLTLGSGGTYTAVAPIFLASATITSNGRTLGSTTVNGAGIAVTLAGALTLGVSNFFFLTLGTINLAGFTLTANSLQSSNSNVRSISFGTGGSIVLITSGGDLVTMGVATNFTRSGTGGITASGSGSALSYQFGPTGATSSNVMDLTVTKTGGAQITFSGGALVGSINCPSGNHSLVTQFSSTTVYGNLTLSATGTYTQFFPSFAASATVTSTGKTLGNTTINGSGITVTLADAMTLSSIGTLTLTQGTFTTANFNVEASSFSSSNSNTRTLNMGSSTWVISGTTSAWNTTTSTGMTLDAGTSTINMTASVGKGFNGGGLTYYNLNQGGAGTLTITGSNTFNDITNTAQPNTVTFTAGTTQTVSNFSLSGTNAASRITISSVTPGVPFTLSKPSGAVNSQFLSIQDSNGTGGASWYATNSTNTGNNTGWIFNNTNGMFAFLV